MGTTAGGIVYPDATDVPDIPADLQALAESVETEYTTGGAWVTATTGFTAASNWTLNTVRYRKIGPLVELYLTITRTTSAITVNASGNISNVAMLSAVPTAIRPTGTVTGYTGSTGRLACAALDSTGAMELSAFAPGADWGSTEAGSFRFFYMLG